jgi:ABC-2 type transport system permease protein
MKTFDMVRALSIARKEARHILRDPFTTAMAFGLPLFMVVFFGLVIDFNVKDIRLHVYDRDASRASRQFLETFATSGSFSLHAGREPGAPALELDRETTKAVLIVEKGFGKELGSGREARAQVLLDGADNSTSGVILGYLEGVKRSFNKKTASSTVPLPDPRDALRTRFLFNPELNTRWFIVPGLAAVVLAILSILLTALTVAREWENGSMEMLLSTPARPLEIVIGKLLPYSVIGLCATALVYFAARLGFGVPFRGSQILYLLSTFLFLSACLAQGLLISVVTRQQALAMQLAMLSGMLPTMLLSGFVFPVESMPRFFHYFTSILPVRWFMKVVRGIFLRGADFGDLLLPFAALTGLMILLTTAATKRFKKDVEP